MFFDHLEQLLEIAQQTSCTVFKLPANTPVNLPHATYLRPDSTKKTPIISIERMREFIASTKLKELTTRFFVIESAESMNDAAANAFLKTLEEPQLNCHFVLLTADPMLLLPTIRSRVQIYYLRQTNQLSQPLTTSEKATTLAKKLIAATPMELIRLAEALAKDKQARELALETATAAVELLYKSYFKTQNPKFIKKIPKFIKLHESLQRNGHIKLHLVADLI